MLNNGPPFTFIEGFHPPWDTGSEVAIRCVYLANGAELSGFTLTNGGGSGGGLWCESTSAVATNCVLVGNSAGEYPGGGAMGGTLNQCTVVGNRGGGIYQGRLNHCIIYHNGANNTDRSFFNYCCTTPLPTNGIRNINSLPKFVDYDRGNLRLQNDSPCINAAERNASKSQAGREPRSHSGL